jgi:hypothetical protein
MIAAETLMLPQLEALAGHLETTAGLLLEAPADRSLQRALLQQIQALSNMAAAPLLPLFLRSLAKDLEMRANRVALIVEAAEPSGLDVAVGELRRGVSELRDALAHGRA